MQTIDAELQAGIAASRIGNKDQARACFIRALKLDPGHAGAWLRLSGVMPTVEQALRCVEHLLSFNPQHPQALEAREVLRVRLLLEEAAVIQTPASPTSTPQRRYLLGEALVEARVLTEQQVALALAEQRKLAQKKKPMRLGEVLLRMKLVRPEQLEAAIASQIETIPASDAGATGQLGDYLLSRQLVTRAQLLQALAKQNELKRQGRPMLLGDVLVLCGYVQREQLNRSLVEWQQQYDTCFR